MPRPDIDVLLFDVFGTVVDWRSAVIAEGEAFSETNGLDLDWPLLADRWRREGYLEPIGRIVEGQEEFTPVDVLFRGCLATLADEFGFSGLGPAALDELALVWERLDPWPDVLDGLARLRARYLISPLSNASFAMLTRMAARAGLPWSCVMGADLFGAYKTDDRVYLGAARLLGSEPSRVLMVAAHPADLRAAARCGLRTAYVPRPLEWGPGGRPPRPFEADIVAGDFEALAAALGT